MSGVWVRVCGPNLGQSLESEFKVKGLSLESEFASEFGWVKVWVRVWSQSLESRLESGSEFGPESFRVWAQFGARVRVWVKVWTRVWGQSLEFGARVRVSAPKAKP